MSVDTYSKHFNTKKTPQRKPIPGKKQVKNAAGGYAYKMDMWDRLDRFLILGTEGGSYYVSEEKLTKNAGKTVMECIQEDGLRTVGKIVEVSVQGRAIKTDPAIFALAMAAKQGDDITRTAAFEALPDVCRVGTHLFHFIEFAENFGGWGRAQRRAVANWYNDKDVDKLAYQLVKYQQRDGWSNKDLFRLSHPKAPSRGHSVLYRWVINGELPKRVANDIRIVEGFEKAKTAHSAREVVSLVRDYGLTREMVPTQFLNDAAVWEALLERMPMWALIRNLGKLTQVGVVKPMSHWSQEIASRLTKDKVLSKARVHPMTVLAAMSTYGRGAGWKGKLVWTPDQNIMNALDEAFYRTFQYVEPTGKRTVLALDVSASMSFERSRISKIPGMFAREASAAMALVTAAVERNHYFVGFTAPSGGRFSYGRKNSKHQLSADGISPLNISPRQRLDDVVRYVSDLPFGATDCALPMLWALKNRIEADAFIIYTDNESWVGDIHASQALDMYRQKMGIAAKMVPVGMVANNYSVGDPNDEGTLNVVGFDTNTPRVISNFIGG